ncbi:MAG: hypothetical protein JJE12_05610 [Anaerolineales bacterium]|nr:hypothetical protein [Anaerolineales bacterium]
MIRKIFTQFITPMPSFFPNNYLLTLKTKKVVIFIFLVFILSGCAAYTKIEQPAHPDTVRISQENSLGQSFVASYDGLQGISLFLKPGPETSGELTLSLYQGSDTEQLIDSVTIQTSEIKAAGFHRFLFTPISGSNGLDYFFELTYDGSGYLRIGSAPGNSYLSGAQYIDGAAKNSQSAFRLHYVPTSMLLGLFLEGITWIGYLCLAILIFGLPGWASLSWLFPPWKKLNWISKISLSIGLGIAFYPVFFLWLDTFGLHSSLLNAVMLPILGLVFILLKFFLEKKDREEIQDRQINTESPGDENTIDLRNGKFWPQLIPDLTFILILLLLIFTRFWPIRSLDAPMWGDSYQHTMMAQLLADNGGLFTYWEPYAQLQSFTYHFGFHSLVANFQLLSGLGAIRSTLWVGQILNIFAIVALYPLAVMISKNKWAGVFAVLIAGMLSSMPMAYVNWGRYTQLAGQVILPAIILIVWKNLDSQQNNFRWNILVWFGLAGLALSHYRVTIFIPLFYVAYFLLHLKDRKLRNLFKETLYHAAGVLVLIIPWVIRLFEGTLPIILGSQLNTSASNVSQAAQNLNTIGDISNYLPPILWLLVLLAVIWGFITRNRKSMIFALWWVFILLAANPNWLRLPGTGVLTNFAVFIAAYFPAGILIGSSGAGFLERIGLITSDKSSSVGENGIKSVTRKSIAWSALLLVSILFISIWFVRPRIRDVRPSEHVLLTRPDLRAAEWIEDNLPYEANFLVNSFFAYGGTLVVGSDGGWWLPLITLRESTQPPLTYGSEQANDPDFIQYTNSLVALIEEKGVNHPDVLSELSKRDITHVYIGQQQGQVNSNSAPLLDINILNDDPNFTVVYNKDRVWIFEINHAEG